MVRDGREELVEFIVHHAFYPVLMADRAGPNRALVEHLQEMTRAKIERFRNCRSIKDVIDNFERDRKTQSEIHGDLRLLKLPVLSDLRQDFERKVYDLGLIKRIARL